MSTRLTIGLASLSALLLLTCIVYTSVMLLDGAPVRAFRNVSAAMSPSLLPGDRFTISERRAPRLRRGLLVAHRWPPDPSKQFVKRIVGLPGDTLAMTDGKLIVDNRALAEPYAWHSDPQIDPVVDDFNWQRAFLVGAAARDTSDYEASRNNWGPIVVLPGEFFVLGDNRDNSLDSRYWGFLPAADVLGTVRRIYFSSDSVGHIRWGRIGLRFN